MICTPDIYQAFRMTLIWPVIVGSIAFLAVRFFVYYTAGDWTRSQAVMAALTGVAAAVVATSIANRWDGSQFFWLAFTIGLSFVAAVLLVTSVVSFWQVRDD